MAHVTPRRSPGELASFLGALEVRVESAVVEHHSVSLPDYPGGPRPGSVLRLSGAGCAGYGENVAFFAQDHDRFATLVERWFAPRAGQAFSVQRALGDEGSPYERAALEAALIDLGLRQAGLSLYELTGVRAAPMRFVSSLAADPEPAARLQRLREGGLQGELKVDVHPSWQAAEVEALAADSSIVIFDFKGRGEVTLARRLDAARSCAWFEDPPAGFEPSTARVSRDAALLDAASVAEALARGEAVNLKAPRMGGPLAVLRGLEQVWARNHSASPEHAYLGGMFETHVGRRQARQLAALYCPSAPNDLALNVAGTAARRERTDSPAWIRLDEIGFGAS